jgi:hypothetical protein
MLSPKQLRVSRESELRFGVIHHDNVTHPRSGCAASDHIAFDEGDLQADA